MSPQALKKLLAARRAAQLLPGRNVQLRRLPGGTVMNFRGGGATFEHPWLVSFDGSEATVLPGTINRVEAEIDGKKLSEVPEPRLAVRKLRLDGEGRGWFAAEVTCDPEKEWGIVKVEIAQVADPDTPDGSAREGINAVGGAAPLPGNRARHPIAMVRQRKDGRADVFQIAFFDLQHRIAFSPDKTPQRHFFY
jgi:hypothetical protein